MSIHDVLYQIKTDYETTIQHATFEGVQKKNGLEAKQALIRSTKVINRLHDHIKSELILHGIDNEKIFPKLGETKPELRVTGLLKQKKQDIAVKPSHIPAIKGPVKWGPLAYEGVNDSYGRELTEKILSINVRSQLSSLAKNTDTLFERTYAESSNLHEAHRNMVLGEVYLIPTHEYCERSMKNNTVAWSQKPVNLQKYISFFAAINHRRDQIDSTLKYERCTLLIVDFRQEQPYLYQTTDELKRDGLVSDGFEIPYETLQLSTFVPDLLTIYDERHDVTHLQAPPSPASLSSSFRLSVGF